MVMSRCDVAFELVSQMPKASQAESLDVLSRLIATTFPPPAMTLLPKRDQPLSAEVRERIADHAASLEGRCRALERARAKATPVFAPLIDGAYQIRHPGTHVLMVCSSVKRR